MERRVSLRTCPECGGNVYVLRGRKQVGPEPGEMEPMLETKYHCRGCVCEWKVRGEPA